MKVGKWSTTPGNNNATPPDGWPEGQAPSTINDCAREMMASIKTMVNTLEYIDYDNTPSFLTATTFSLGTADSNWEVGRRVKLFDATTLYGTITSVSSTFVQVRLDSGALTSSLSSAALAIIRSSNNSLPRNSFRNDNVIINGRFDLWQRGVTFANASGYTADRWVLERGITTGGQVTVAQQTRASAASNVPTLAQCGQFLNNSLAVTVTSADTMASSSTYMILSYRIEGYDWVEIAHKPLGLGFWVNTNCSGIYTLAMRGAAFSQTYLTNYTISTVNTWQRVFLTLPEATTSGTWNYSSSVGLALTWTLAAHSAWQGTAGEWSAKNLLATASQVNFMASAGNSFALANVTLIEGHADLPTSVRNISEEFNRCLRYYWRGLPLTAMNFGSFTSGESLAMPISWPVPMRDVPTVTATLPTVAYSFCQSLTANVATAFGCRMLLFSNAANVNCSVVFTPGSDIFEADAEL